MQPMAHDCREPGIPERMAKAKLIAFDLDNTLASLRQPMSEAMAHIVYAILSRIPVGIVTGGRLSLVEHQILSVLPADTPLERLHMMPTNGTSYYRVINGRLHCVYEHDINDEETNRIVGIVRKEAIALGLWKQPGDKQLWGQQIEHRASQITFSALGQLAPPQEKIQWDPTGALQRALVEAIRPQLPEFEVRAGGETSVDIYRRGENKAHALQALSQACGIALVDMVFVGDKMHPGGNDYPPIFTPVTCVKVNNPQDTLCVCNALLQVWQTA